MNVKIFTKASETAARTFVAEMMAAGRLAEITVTFDKLEVWFA
jgi:hypothetical protein